MELLSNNYKFKKSNDNNLYLIINDNGFIEFIYDNKTSTWHMFKTTNNIDKKVISLIDISLLKDLSKKELKEASDGVIPNNYEDILNLCDVSDLDFYDIIQLLKYKYLKHFDPYNLESYVYNYLNNSFDLKKAYYELDAIFDEARKFKYDDERIVIMIRKLSSEVNKNDIFDEISFNDGFSKSHNSFLSVSGYDGYVITFSDRYYNDGFNYIIPFFTKHYNKNLYLNQQSKDSLREFYSLNSIKKIINDIKNTIISLKNNIETEYTKIISKIDSKLSIKTIIDFYEKFIYRLEFLYRIAKEKKIDSLEFCYYN